MGKFLDIDDVAAGNPVAEKELAELRERIEELERERDEFGARVAAEMAVRLAYKMIDLAESAAEDGDDNAADAFAYACDVCMSEVKRLRREAEADAERILHKAEGDE